MTVFSAQAEVFLGDFLNRRFCFRFLRASGGVSVIRSAVYFKPAFSPRKRRCFWYTESPDWIGSVFSAQAEVFPSM